MEVNGNYGQQPGKGAAIASLVLGIIAIVLWWFGYSSFISLILSIIGLVLASNAKKAGYVGGHPHCRVCTLLDWPHWWCCHLYLLRSLRRADWCSWCIRCFLRPDVRNYMCYYRSFWAAVCFFTECV